MKTMTCCFLPRLLQQRKQRWGLGPDGLEG